MINIKTKWYKHPEANCLRNLKNGIRILVGQAVLEFFFQNNILHILITNSWTNDQYIRSQTWWSLEVPDAMSIHLNCKSSILYIFHLLLHLDEYYLRQELMNCLANWNFNAILSSQTICFSMLIILFNKVLVILRQPTKHVQFCFKMWFLLKDMSPNAA